MVSVYNCQGHMLPQTDDCKPEYAACPNENEPSARKRQNYDDKSDILDSSIAWGPDLSDIVFDGLHALDIIRLWIDGHDASHGPGFDFDPSALPDLDLNLDIDL